MRTRGYGRGEEQMPMLKCTGQKDSCFLKILKKEQLF
jgi:hypothetical protein